MIQKKTTNGQKVIERIETILKEEGYGLTINLMTDERGYVVARPAIIPIKTEEDVKETK